MDASPHGLSLRKITIHPVLGSLDSKDKGGEKRVFFYFNMFLRCNLQGGEVIFSVSLHKLCHWGAKCWRLGEPQPVLLSVKEKALPYATFLLLLFKIKLQLCQCFGEPSSFVCLACSVCMYWKQPFRSFRWLNVVSSCQSSYCHNSSRQLLNSIKMIQRRNGR